MANAGITRIHITNQVYGPGSNRFRESEVMQPKANALYRHIFEYKRTPLSPGDSEIRCDLDEFRAGYDHLLGIDVLLELQTGQTLTMQEKFLFTKYNTVTVEWHQNQHTKEPGDWFNLKCQLYFVGYVYPKIGAKFTSWILLDWAKVVMATAQRRIPWRVKPNNNDGARADFKYCRFDRVPLDCIIAKGA